MTLGTVRAQTATQAAEALRLWKRQVARAGKLQATLPDATLQVQALDIITQGRLQQDPKHLFESRPSECRVALWQECTGAAPEATSATAKAMVASVGQISFGPLQKLGHRAWAQIWGSL